MNYTLLLPPAIITNYSYRPSVKITHYLLHPPNTIAYNLRHPHAISTNYLYHFSAIIIHCSLLPPTYYSSLHIIHALDVSSNPQMCHFTLPPEVSTYLPYICILFHS